MTRWVILAVAASTALSGSEPQPRKAAPAPLKINTPPAYLSAAAELAGGRLLVSDARTPAVHVIDPATGDVRTIGSVGAGPDQYVRPGGLYGGADGTLLLLDRAQLRVSVISPAGAFTRHYSIAITGTQSASDADVDLQRIDSRGFSYFTERAFGPRATGTSRPSFPLVRFDPAAQQRQTVAGLTQPETMTVDRGNGLTVSRTVIGSPSDGFGVTPDGRVAVVRGEPYRVDWIETDGRVTRGPAVVHDPVPMTDADRAAYRATSEKGPSVGTSASGGAGGGLSGLEPRFAETKAPFRPEDVIVSPDGRVWVLRSRAATTTAVTYDVFDGRGQRIDRLEFPDRSLIIGFGKGAVYVRESGADGRVTLKKYLVR
jgi:sugar lactone lactonase YvrE